jgi:hypothetical protein
MNYSQLMHDASADPARLEQVYQEALTGGSDAGFADAVHAAYGDAPDNLLYAAWHYRLARAAQTIATRPVPWLFALALALANGLLLWLLSDDTQFMITINGSQAMPYFALLWGPLAGVFVLAWLARCGALSWRTWGLLAAGLAALAVAGLSLYSLIDDPALQQQYVILAALHLPLAAWALVGIGALHGLGGARDRFAFLLKSLELYILGGLFLSALGVLTAVTLSLFQALGIDLPLVVQRLLIAGGAGLVPVLAVALGYDAGKSPAEQSFEGGLSRLLAVLLRLFLPLTLAVLVIYVGFVPFFFWRPFENRDVLITYNAMLFAVLALLLGVTPLTLRGLGEGQQRWLRRGIIAVAALAALVSVYALGAIVYRTVLEGLTLNRVAFIGWNVINTLLLLLLIARQWRSAAVAWLPAVQSVFGLGALLYAAWSLFVILALPLLF